MMLPETLDTRYNQLWAFITLAEIHGMTDGFRMLINTELSELEAIYYYVREMCFNVDGKTVHKYMCYAAEVLS